MKNLEQWFIEYGRDHQNPTNQLIHKICVPLIMFSLLGLLWEIPKPSAFQFSPFFNWSFLFIVGCLGFYYLLSRVYFLFMSLLAVLMLAALNYLSQTSFLLELSIGTFVIAWIGQFVGHKIEGQKPSFFEDLQFLLIGPLWIMKDLPILKNQTSASSAN